MAWNEPKDQKPEDYDPWTGQAKPSNTKSNQSPPLLEDLIKALFKKISGRGFSDKKNELSKNGFWLLLALIAIAWFAMGFFQINRNQEALIFRFGVFQNSLDTGFYWRPWGIYRVQRFDREEKINQTLATDVISQDANLAHIAIKLTYHVNSPKDYILHYANSPQLIQTIGANVLQQTAANNKLDAILANTKHAMFNLQLQQNLANALTQAQTGVQLDQIELSAISVPDSIKTTFNKIDALYEQQSNQRQQAADYEHAQMPAAEAKVVAQIADANAFAEQAKLKALQDVADFLAIYPVYKQNPHFMRYQLYSQAMKDMLAKTTNVVVDEKVNGAAFYLPPTVNHATPTSIDSKTTTTIAPIDNPSSTDAVDDSYGNVQGGY